MRRTSAMVEAGIMAAIAVVLALVGMYMPVIGGFINFVWPLPIIICGMRNGLKYSIMTLVVACVIVAIIISPLQAFFLGAIFGLLGLILGECMRRHLPPMRLMLFASLGAVLALVINLVLSFAVLDIDPVAMLFNQFDSSMTAMSEFYRSHGVSEEDTKAAVEKYGEMLKMMRVIMPAAFLVFAPVLAFINYYAAKKILTRLGESFEDLPPFVNWIIPTWVLFPFCLSLVGVTYFYINKLQDSWMYKVCVNIQTICTFVLVFQAVVLVYWYIQRKNKPKWWAGVITTLVFIVPILSQIMVYVGAFDMIADFRKIRKDYLPAKKTKK